MAYKKSECEQLKEYQSLLFSNWIRVYHHWRKPKKSQGKTSSPDQSVDLADLDVVQLLDCGLDLMLVSFQVSDENQSVVIFDLLHSRLSGQRMFDNIVGIHTVAGRGRLPRVLGVPGGSEGPWPSKVHSGADLLDAGAMGTLNNLLLDLLGLLD